MPTLQNPSLQQIDAIRALGLRPQVVACLIHNETVLLVYGKKYQLWQIPQGGIQNHETAPQALRREIKEELGKTLYKSITLTPIQISTQKINFPTDKHGVKKLTRDDGTEITMTGKYYFVYALPCKTTTIDIIETQFDHYQWCTRYEAQKLIATIYQNGKRRMTSTIIDELYTLGMIE